MTVLVQAHALRKSFARTEALRGVSVEIGAGRPWRSPVPPAAGSPRCCCASPASSARGRARSTYDRQRLDRLGEADRTRAAASGDGDRAAVRPARARADGGPERRAARSCSSGTTGRPPVERALSWLERLGAADLADQVPAELSGGQAQRVAVARALVTGPKVVFADEPTGALDTVAGEQVLGQLLGAVRDTGATLVMVTHDNRVAARADREVVLRDGSVEAAGVVS